jgi:hypothetical protein
MSRVAQKVTKWAGTTEFSMACWKEL